MVLFSLYSTSSVTIDGWRLLILDPLLIHNHLGPTKNNFLIGLRTEKPGQSGPLSVGDSGP